METIRKVSEGRPNVVDLIKNGEIQLVINVSLGRRSSRDAYHIRRGALLYNVLYTTTISGARALAEAIDALQKETWDVTPLQAYHGETAAGDFPPRRACNCQGGESSPSRTSREGKIMMTETG